MADWRDTRYNLPPTKDYSSEGEDFGILFKALGLFALVVVSAGLLIWALVRLF